MYNIPLQVKYLRRGELWIMKGTQSCPTVPTLFQHCTVHGILQTRILEWVAVPFSRGSSRPRDRTQVSWITGGFFTSWATGKPKNTGVGSLSLLQGVFSTQELNRGLLHCRQILYQLSYQGNPEERWGEPNILLEKKSCFSKWGETQHNLELKGPQLHENFPIYLSLNFQGPILSQSKSQTDTKKPWEIGHSIYPGIQPYTSLDFVGIYFQKSQCCSYRR